ncbi:hypothetical protein Tco_1039420 [Tanacetum coccineum]
MRCSLSNLQWYQDPWFEGFSILGSKSLKVSVHRGHFLDGVERLFSAWAIRFNDNEKVQQVRVNSNKVLREVTGETTTAGVWSKLETLYMTKSLANKLYLKKKLYTFCMPAGRKISEHIDEFNKIVLDLANIERIRLGGWLRSNQPPDLTEYQLVRDREPRTRTKPLRFRDESNMAAYAFVATEEEDTDEPLTYQEAIACEDSSKWKATMEEEMDSLRKNKT